MADDPCPPVPRGERSVLSLRRRWDSCFALALQGRRLEPPPAIVAKTPTRVWCPDAPPTVIGRSAPLPKDPSLESGSRSRGRRAGAKLLFTAFFEERPQRHQYSTLVRRETPHLSISLSQPCSWIAAGGRETTIYLTRPAHKRQPSGSLYHSSAAASSAVHQDHQTHVVSSLSLREENVGVGRT